MTARLSTCALLLLALPACNDEPSEPDGGPLDAADASTASIEAGTSTPPSSSGSKSYGAVYHDGQFHLGPVDFEETEYHNACASEQKYLPAVRATAGKLLAGVWGGLPAPESLCDSCIRVDTAAGKSAVLRVVTYGESTRNSLDVSQEAYAILNSDEFPRAMTWQSVRCADTGAIRYEFRSGSHAYWTSFWVRNARVPIAKVEAKARTTASRTSRKRATERSSTTAGSVPEHSRSV